MDRRTAAPARVALALALAAAGLADAAPVAARALRVVATVPDLGSLAEAVGGDELEIAVLAKGPQDPHFVEPRPSFVRRLHAADVFLQVGMDLEAAWAPTLLRRARNPDVRPGGRGFVDASTAIRPLEVPTQPVDRSQGDVHPFGNPHYLTDPVNGLRVAALIRDTLIELRPEAAARFRAGYAAFAEALVAALVGADLAARHGAARLAQEIDAGTLPAFLAERGEGGQLAGWLGAMRTSGIRAAVQDHRLWPYFAARFGLRLVETLEPRPGIPPTTRHLAAVVARMQADGVSLVLASPYFDPRHARWVSKQTGARIAEMAPQVASREGCDDYLATVDCNVREVLGAP